MPLWHPFFVSLSDKLFDLRVSCDKDFDLVIVGGGIAGAGIALEASQRGLKALLTERDDFGGEASAGCFGILHGGVRYLQQFDLPRLFESAREQQILRRIAPNHFLPLPIVFPCRGLGIKSRWVLSSAIRLFEAIAGFRNSGIIEETRLASLGTLSAAELIREFPGMPEPQPSSGVVYSDAQFASTQRFLMAVLRSAVRAGARCMNYTELSDIKLRGVRSGEQGRWKIQLRDRLTNQSQLVSCSCIINATGHHLEHFYNEHLAPELGAENLSPRRFVKAIQLVIPRCFNRGVAMESPQYDAGSRIKRGGRSFFLIPSGPHTLVGTYEIVADAADSFAISSEEIDSFMGELVQSYRFERTPQVLSAWGGFIPLEWMKDGKKYSVARDDLLLEHGSPLRAISIAAVKYSTFRKTAERVVDRLARTPGLSPRRSISSNVPLLGSEMGGIDSFKSKFGEILSRYQGEVDVEYLYRSYGSNIASFPELAARYGTADLWGLEIAFAREFEFARTEEDFLRRRLPISRSLTLDSASIARVSEFFSMPYGRNR